MINKKILNLQDLVEMTGLSKSHIYKLTHKRILPHYKPNGKVIFFKYNEVEEWIFSKKIQSVSEIELQASNYMFKSKSN